MRHNQQNHPSRSKVKVKYAKNRYFSTAYQIKNLFTFRSGCERHQTTRRHTRMRHNQQNHPSRSKVKVKYAKDRYFSTVPNKKCIYRPIGLRHESRPPDTSYGPLYSDSSMLMGPINEGRGPERSPRECSLRRC